MTTIARMAALTLTALALFATTARAEEGDESEAPAEETAKPEKSSAAKASDDDPAVIKVIKVKKSSAVVVFSKKHSPLRVGQKGRVVPLAAKESVEVEGPSRAHFIGVDSNFEILDSKTDPGGGKSSSKAFNANLTYGWNKERFEYGATLGYEFTTVGDPSNSNSQVDTKLLLLGAVFDFNFKPNTLENDFIIAFRFSGGFGQVDNSAQKSAGTAWQVEPGLAVKWFGLSPNLGATGFVGYRMRNVTIDSAKTATSGIVGRIGIQAYF